MVQARNTERRWSRALQHEHSLRLQLQDNMEALANQMHGLEDEARLSMQHISPSLNTLSHSGSGLSTPTTESSEQPNVISRTTQISEVVSFEDREKELSNEPDGISADESEDDEDKFFDAPETSAPETPSLPLDNFAIGHKRNISTASVNDTSFMKSAPDTDVKEKLPKVSSDRRMTVS